MKIETLEPEVTKFAWSPFIAGAATFAILMLGVLIFIRFYDVSNLHIPALALILALSCCVLIAKHVYDEVHLRSLVNERLRQSLEKALKPAQLLFSVAYQNGPVAYVVSTSDGVIKSVNTAATRLLGQPAEGLVGGSLFTLLKTDDSDHYGVLSSKIRSGLTITNEEMALYTSSRTSWVQLSAFPYVDDIGKKLYLITLVDVTKQKEIEVAKSEFVSLASHQLRTPITGMRWSAELLLMDGGDALGDQQKKYINRLLDSINRMNSLVDDFLQVSRFELGTRTVETQVIDLPRLFADVMHESSLMVHSKKLIVEFTPDQDCQQITSDLSLMRIIVTNLYTNALKYTQMGGHVSVSYKQDQGNLLITVSDTGMGIPESEQPKIFTKVFRASNALKEVPDGTGLGLYITKQATQVLGGRISFDSVETVGTTFSVVIPL